MGTVGDNLTLASDRYSIVIHSEDTVTTTLQKNMNIIISVNHTDDTGKYWSDSSIKNKIIDVLEGETIHQAIGRTIESEDYCKMAYKGKPKGNVYRDQKDGTAKIVGYHYRTKHYIENRSDNIQKENVPFTTWVTIHGQVIPATLEDIELS